MVLIRSAAARSLSLALLAIAGPLSSLAYAGHAWDSGVNNDWMTGTLRLTPFVDGSSSIRPLLCNIIVGSMVVTECDRGQLGSNCDAV